MNKHIIFLMTTILLISACAPASGAARAEETLTTFFEHLHQGRYAQAAALYGGSYEALVAANPGLDPDDTAALLQNACQVNGYQCLAIRTVIFNEYNDRGEYAFTVEFDNPDGSLFVRGACCGEEPTTPPQSRFEIRVVEAGSGEFQVLDLPVYTP